MSIFQKTILKRKIQNEIRYWWMIRLTPRSILLSSYSRSKYSYSKVILPFSSSIEHATPHANIYPPIQHTIPFHRNFSTSSNSILFQAKKEGNRRKEGDRSPLFLFLARRLASRTFGSVVFSCLASPRDRKYSYRRRNSRSWKGLCLCAAVVRASRND